MMAAGLAVILPGSAPASAEDAVARDTVHVTFVQPSLSDISNLRWNTLISLQMPLYKWVSIRTSFANTYESEVEATRSHHDSIFTFGVSLGNSL